MQVLQARQQPLVDLLHRGDVHDLQEHQTNGPRQHIAESSARLGKPG